MKCTWVGRCRSVLIAAVAVWGATAPAPPATGAAATGQEPLEQAFAAYWSAPDLDAALEAADRIVAQGAEFDELLDRLAAGPPFDSEVPTGHRMMERRGADGTRYPFLVVIPDDYDAGRRYPVRVYLHGGVNRPLRDGDGGWWREPDRVADGEHIAVFPYSWNEALWWQANQGENLNGILWRLKRTYNVDDNRVTLYGVSDGGTGAWFFAFRDTTPWAAFLPFIAHPAVLSNPRIGADGDLFPINLRNKPHYVVNGGQDRLYPVDAVAPYIRLFEQVGVELTFVTKPEAGHTTAWWPEEAGAIEAFLDAAVRDPYPDRLWWRTDRTDRYQRAHWVLIEELDSTAAPIDELNQVAVRGRTYDAFPRRGPSGQLDVVHAGNQIDVTAHGVLRYKLLLAPEEFDFSEPIVIRTNGEESFRGLVERDPSALLGWAAIDADRTMLFAAELSIEVRPPAPR